MPTRFFIFILYMVCINNVQAQSMFNGIVKDSLKNIPLSNAIITITDTRGETLGYQITDNNGLFSIEVTAQIQGLIVSASLLGYDIQSTKVDNGTQTVNFFLISKNIDLEEIVVEGRPLIMRNDTLSYNVNAFKNQQDRNIGDLLKKLPGIEVMPNGAIRYQGEPINKFYINGMDLLDMKYGIATQNLPVNAVSSVEVLENHQPLKLLRGVATTGKAAINLKLSKKALRPVGTVEAAAGVESSDLLWLLNLFMLNARDTNQILAYYKTNNIGQDIANELTLHDLQDSYKRDKFEDRELFNHKIFNYINLSPERFLFNKTHAVTLNNLNKKDNEKQIRVNLDYLNETKEEYISETSNYYLSDGSLEIIEINQLKSLSNTLNGAITYNKNSSKVYINNEMKVKLKWENSYVDLVQSSISANQKYTIPQFTISNDAQYIKRNDKTLFDFSSFIRYSSLPQKLNVNITNGLTTNEPKQRVKYSGLYTYSTTNFTYHNNKSSLSVDLALEGILESFSSENSQLSFVDTTRNKLKNDNLIIHVIPKYIYDNQNKFSFELLVPIKQYFIFYNNKILDKNSNTTPFIINPKSAFKWKFNAFWESRLTYQYNKTFGDIFNYPSSVVMQDYRTFEAKSGVLSETKSNTASLKFNYRNPLRILFANTSITYQNTLYNLLSSRYFTDKQSISSNQQKNNRREYWNWNTYLGKYISAIKTTITLNSGVSYIKSERSQQDVLYPINNLAWYISPKLSANISESLSATYQTTFSKSTLEINRSKSSINELAQSFLCLYSIKNIQLTFQGEHLYNKMQQTNTSINLFFADLSLKYIFKEVEISIDWNNILNEKSYSYTSFSGLDTYQYNFNLRESYILGSIKFRY